MVQSPHAAVRRHCRSVDHACTNQNGDLLRLAETLGRKRAEGERQACTTPIILTLRTSWRHHQRPDQGQQAPTLHSHHSHHARASRQSHDASYGSFTTTGIWSFASLLGSDPWSSLVHIPRVSVASPSRLTMQTLTVQSVSHRET